MLEDRDAIATIAVKDLDVSSKFYEDTLGLKPDENQGPGARSYRSGDTGVLVYESRYAGTNQATAATWFVDDVDRIVKDLKAKGVVFEHYDMPETTRKGDVHVAGSMKAAWFKDPDGNILALISQ
jgi:catechol 2,3-dioxygenase-like lactoylglutathione lyase family enzyme